jgi:Holliday junction resolvase-like predicted endonuclease
MSPAAPAAHLTYDLGDELPGEKLRAFLEANNITWTDSEWFHSGAIDIRVTPLIPRTDGSFPDYIKAVTFSTFFGSNEVPRVAVLAYELWLRHGGHLSAGTGVRPHIGMQPSVQLITDEAASLAFRVPDMPGARHFGTGSAVTGSTVGYLERLAAAGRKTGVGITGSQAAADYLSGMGMTILEVGYTGGPARLDVIASDGDRLVVAIAVDPDTTSWPRRSAVRTAALRWLAAGDVRVGGLRGTREAYTSVRIDLLTMGGDEGAACVITYQKGA